MKNYTTESAKANFEEMLEHALQGLTVIITGSDNQDYELVLKPLPSNKPRKPGSLKGKIKIAEEFDAPMPEFTPYVE
ncbi:MAG: type II toxin-antitoxin system prevent-host-death family antitoxin [Chloroflexi bacterium]|nr:type II toxin-antitoxin system prevent-host-death family antitoxin [Chloroflexota bacterium]